MLLHSKIIFITGGSQGIGLECSKAYSNEGALLAIAAKDEREFEGLAEEVGSSHLYLTCNVCNEQEVKHAIEKTVHHFGQIDAIHNNAGIASPSKTLHDTSAEEWELLMHTNLRSIYFTTRYGFEYLKQSKGSVLNTSSMVAEMGQEIHAAYAATKGAVNTLTKSMALDYAKYGVRVNAVAPAAVWTPMLRNWANEQPNTTEIKNYLNQIHALGYCPEADVVADACVFLLSEKARFITGCILPVSGGAELGYKIIL